MPKGEVLERKKLIVATKLSKFKGKEEKKKVMKKIKNSGNQVVENESKKKKKKQKEWYFTPNVAKRAGLVNWVCGQTGYGSKRVNRVLG